MIMCLDGRAKLLPPRSTSSACWRCCSGSDSCCCGTVAAAAAPGTTDAAAAFEPLEVLRLCFFSRFETSGDANMMKGQ